MSDYTSAIDNYDGIFKCVHSPTAKKLFLKARAKLALGDREGSYSVFKECQDIAEKLPEDVATVDLILKELDRLTTSNITDDVIPTYSVDWSDVRNRRLKRLDEHLTDLPQGVFVLTIPYEDSTFPIKLVGRKLLSEKWQANKIQELFCSIVRAEMILGTLDDFRITDEVYTVFYRPLTQEEKLCVLKDAAEKYGKTSDIIFPFPLLKKDTKREFTSPIDGWTVDDAYDVMLSHGEEHIRQFTVKYISTLRLNRPHFYDPACSTGIFLASLKAAFPDSYTIGQDLSRQMTDVSEERVDEVHCGTALHPMIESGSADVVFVRFLNSEVVRRAEAEELLKALQPTVRSGGHMIILGHTPVLLSASDFVGLSDFTLRSNIGMTEDQRGIFQYYVLQKY